MKDRIKRLASGRGFYGVCALGVVCLAVLSVTIFRTGTSASENITVRQNSGVYTEQAQIPQSQVPDPREITEESTTKISTTEAASEPESTTVREESTAIEPVSTTLNEAEVFSNDGFILPVEGKLVKEFSPTVPVYDETMGDWRVHNGADLEAEAGQEILSVGNGQVKKLVSDPSYGYIAEVDYGSFTVRYCGLQQGSVLKTNTIVKKGDVIGRLGTNPCESEDGAHLHLEVLENGKYIDPMTLSAQ